MTNSQDWIIAAPTSKTWPGKTMDEKIRLYQEMSEKFPELYRQKSKHKLSEETITIRIESSKTLADVKRAVMEVKIGKWYGNDKSQGKTVDASLKRISYTQTNGYPYGEAVLAIKSVPNPRIKIKRGLRVFYHGFGLPTKSGVIGKLGYNSPIEELDKGLFPELINLANIKL